MLNSLKRNPIIFAICFFSIFTLARLFFMGDPSKFIVAGTDFYNPTQWQDKIHLEEGQGYDGQFFFQYAHNPFSLLPQNHSKIDLPGYRHQRIMYPALVWLLSFNNPTWIPGALILINFLAAVGLSFFILQFTKTNNNWLQRLAPILAPGLLMSLSRDLSEVVATFFLVGSLYFITNKKPLLFAIFGASALLTRETEVVLLGPIILWYLLQKQTSIFKKGISLLPIIILFIWKLILLKSWYPNYEAPTQNLTFPLLGLMKSLWINFHFTGLKGLIELVFWLVYAVLIGVTFRTSIKNILEQKSFFSSPFPLIILAAVGFSLIFSEAIYIDDWAFVRVLVSATVICLIYLTRQNKISKSLMFFLLFSSSITFARLVFRI